MKNQNVVKILGIGVSLLGIILLFVLGVGIYQNTVQQNTELLTTDLESRYISTDQLDNTNLPENSIDEELKIDIPKEELEPQKQGVLVEDTSRQILKVDNTLSLEEKTQLEQEYNIQFTDDDPENGVYVINVTQQSNTSGLTQELNARTETDIPVKMAADLVDWGISRIGADKVWTEASGNGVKVAVIDTGVQLTHPDLANNIVTGYDFVNNDSNPSDDNGHGTHVAGIVAAVQNQSGVIGASYSAKIMPIKALNSDGYGYLSDVAKGIYYAVDNGARIINMSLGSPTDSLVLKDAVNYAANKGVLVVAAAGNNAGAPCMYPGAYSNAICVVATDSNNRLASFSNLGGELAAPGVSNYSTYLGSTYKYLSGTSMASPHVAGSAALLMSQCSTCSTSAIRTLLRESAIDLGETGTDIIFGYGLVDLVSAIDLLNPQDEQPVADQPTEEPTPDPVVEEPIKPKDITQTVKIFEPEKDKNKRYIPEEYEDINIEFGLTPTSEESKILRIDLYLDNTVVYTTNKQSDEYTLTLETLDTSQHWVRAVAYFNDKKVSHDSMIIDLTQFKVEESSVSKGRGRSVLGISTYFDWLFR